MIFLIELNLSVVSSWVHIVGALRPLERERDGVFNSSKKGVGSDFSHKKVGVGKTGLGVVLKCSITSLGALPSFVLLLSMENHFILILFTSIQFFTFTSPFSIFFSVCPAPLQHFSLCAQLIYNIFLYVPSLFTTFFSVCPAHLHHFSLCAQLKLFRFFLRQCTITIQGRNHSNKIKKSLLTAAAYFKVSTPVQPQRQWLTFIQE